MTNSYNQSYRGAGRSKSTTTTSVQPEMEIVLNKQEVIYTDQDNRHYLLLEYKQIIELIGCIIMRYWKLMMVLKKCIE